jgi:hypothetical protein
MNDRAGDATIGELNAGTVAGSLVAGAVVGAAIVGGGLVGAGVDCDVQATPPARTTASNKPSAMPRAIRISFSHASQRRNSCHRRGHCRATLAECRPTWQTPRWASPHRGEAGYRG